MNARILLLLPFWLCPGNAFTADWPTYRADAARSGYTAEPLQGSLSLQWIYRAQKPQSAWPTSNRQRYDRADHVVVAGNVVVFGSSGDGCLRGLNAASGEDSWSFHTDAPIRVSPTIWKGRVYAASDDGFLYCVDAKSGALRWKKRGGPGSEMILGNDRLCSAWPARGAPAIVDGVVFWAAGIWPSDGIHVYALDAASGEQIWQNDADGTRFMPQPHGGANARSGLSAQGHIAVAGDLVYLPTGRAVPAALTRTDGKFTFFHLQKYGQLGGSSIVCLEERFHNGGRLFDRVTGLETGTLAGAVARLGAGVVQATATKVIVHEWIDREKVDRKGKPVKVRGLRKVADVKLSGRKLQVIGVGSSIVVGGEDSVAAVDPSAKKVIWKSEVHGDAYGLAFASGRLYVSTDEGLIYCFGAKAPEGGEVVHPAKPRSLPPHDQHWADTADAILSATGVDKGYCVDLGCGDGSLALEMARQSHLQIYCVDDDMANVRRARQRLDDAGLYGSRVVVHHRDLKKTGYPKLFANLVVSARSSSGDGEIDLDASEVKRLTRPWGGVAALGPAGSLRIARRGALEGAGSWTHQYSNPANTCCSNDARVKGPLRMLWFRDADLRMPQRHGRAPAPLFHEGYLIVEGLNAVRVSDAYNGRTIWEHSLPGILKPYDQDHLSGTAGTGSNICVDGDSVFVHRKTHCLRLDLSTGRKLGEFAPPKRPDGKPGAWGYLAVADGVLYGTVANPDHIVKWQYLKGDMSEMFSESFSLFAMSPETGEVLWQHQARRSIRHNAIAIGGGRVYLIDRALAEIDGVSFRRKKPEAKKPKAEKPEDPPHPDGELVALDAKTGKLLWSKKEEVYGTLLAVNVEENALLMSYQPTRFRLPSEKGGRMAVYHTKDGYRLWDKKVSYDSRPLINDKTIYAQGGAWDLRSGVERPFPFKRSYGCGILAGSKDLMVFRSATLGYWDLRENKEAKNYGGLRIGCWINAIPAGGILLVPDGSSGCKCSYLNQASLALQSAE